jgi:calcineurin-like phosphoesterase family protein
VTTFFTADHHFGHARIIELCDRPFSSIEEMNETLIDKWNAVVKPGDTVWHLGDVAMGPITQSLSLISRLNGHKYLVPGNHDRCSPAYAGTGVKRVQWIRRYWTRAFMPS